MPARLTASAAMIMLARGRRTNQERLNVPLTETEAWTLFRESHSLDMQRLAAHRLFDLAIAARDVIMLDSVVTLLEKELATVCCDGLLRRIARQNVCRGWRKWADKQLRTHSVQPLAA